MDNQTIDIIGIVVCACLLFALYISTGGRS